VAADEPRRQDPGAVADHLRVRPLPAQGVVGADGGDAAVADEHGAVAQLAVRAAGQHVPGADEEVGAGSTRARVTAARRGAISADGPVWPHRVVKRGRAVSDH
jgi:hypothetical protein